MRVKGIDGRLWVDPDTYFAGVYVRGVYEREVVRYLRNTLKPGMTCLDVGANIGFFSVLMAKKVGPAGLVVAFEPTARTFSLLQRNVAVNRLSNVVMERLAVSDRGGSVAMREGPPGYEVYNTTGVVTHPSAVDQTFHVRSVPCVTLDQYLGAHSIPHVDLIKIDVEGAELAVLRGAIGTFESNPRVRLIVEFADQTTRGFGYSASDLASWLSERGWELWLVGSRGRLRQLRAASVWRGEMVLAYRPRVGESAIP